MMILQKAYTNQNFSKEKYQLGNYCLIQFQILQTKITLIVRQTVRKITNEILGVKGLRHRKFLFTLQGSTKD